LLLLTESRHAARTTGEGKLVPLAEQDRIRWDQSLIAEGQQLVRGCLRRNQPGPYQVQAAIAAVHSDARDAARTDWRQVLALYDQLAAIAPTPVATLNRAVALAEVAGPAAALAAVEDLPLATYHLYHALRGDLLRRLNRSPEAAAAYDRAIALAENAAELEFLTGRRAALAPAKREAP
jgi:RNA polymerase sigma-70 factor (ECF subfamily)